MDSIPRHQFPLRLAIIHGNRTKSELLLHYCASNWGIEVVGLATTAGASLDLICRTRPDLLLISASSCENGTADFLAAIRKMSLKPKLVFLSSDWTDYLIHHLTGVAYHGLICTREEGLIALGHIIDRIRNGFRFVSSTVQERQNLLRLDPHAFPKLLTDRHMEVLICVSHALSDAEIASQLGCSVHTAAGHRQKIMRKLGIRSTPKLIRYGAAMGFGSAVLPRRQGS